LKILKEKKIHVVVDHIFGIPGESEDDLLDAAKFYNEHRPDRIVSYYLTYYPGTEIAEIAKNMGIISERVKLMQDGVPLTYFDPKGESMEDRNRFNSFRNLFSLIPFVPKKVSDFFIDNRRYKYLSKIPFIFTGIFPNIARAILGKEIKANQMISNFLYNLIKLGY
jgi:radical SAM superfamily enzyme YgiQ (UPF0313 family)